METLYELMAKPLEFVGTLNGLLVFTNDYFTCELEATKKFDIVAKPTTLLLYDLSYKHGTDLFVTHKLHGTSTTTAK